MGVLDFLTGMLTSEGKHVYRCEGCDSTVKVNPDVDNPECSGCGSNNLTFVNAV